MVQPDAPGHTRPAIEISGLHKEFVVRSPMPFGRGRRPVKVALVDLSLLVPCGQAVAILGPNGAGKSTLLRILATLVHPTAGQVRILGGHLTDSGTVRRQIGWATGDDRSFYWPLTGRANLEFFATLGGLHGADARARIAAVLAQVDLTAMADTAYRAYSSGMRQRLALARALLHEPSLLLLDEPTRSLDPVSADRVRRLLRSCRDRGQTLLWVTHNPSEAVQYCDRVIWMRTGRIIADRPSGQPGAADPPAVAEPA